MWALKFLKNPCIQKSKVMALTLSEKGHADQSVAWRKVEMAHYRKWLNNNGAVQGEEAALLLNVTLEYKVNKTPENAIWHLWSSVSWESRCTFTQTPKKSCKEGSD